MYALKNKQKIFASTEQPEIHLKITRVDDRKTIAMFLFWTTHGKSTNRCDWLKHSDSISILHIQINLDITAGDE